MRTFFCLVSLVVLSGKISFAEPAAAGAKGTAPSLWPGRQPDGSVLLPNQWSLLPAGQQITLGDFPVNLAVHPGGKFVAALHAGYSRHEIVIVDLRSAQIVSRTPVNEAFYGLEFSANGRRLFCSGAGDEVVHAFDFQAGQLAGHREIKIHDRKQRGVPCGLALDAKASRLFVANVWGQRVSVVELASKAHATDIALAAETAPLDEDSSKPAPDADTRAADKRARAARVPTRPDDPFPYACRLDEKQNRLYVSLWAQAAVAVLDLNSNRVVARWPTEDHPCEMTLARSGKFLFVANANRNTVTVLDTQTGTAVETIWAAFFPQSPPGATPNSLALSPDERTLFVANANVNAVAVFDVSAPGHSRSLGFIPVGWYPTSVRVTPDGKALLVANGKGVAPQANPLGPQPGVREDTNPTTQYIGRLLHGTLSVIPLPAANKFEDQMAVWTAEAYRCTPLKADAGVTRPPPAENPVPARPGMPGPIQYCIYLIKENRTYDQVFGDMPQGNGDPSLCLFPARVTPNHHLLAQEFVLLDNFYAEAEVSAGGHEWSMGAYATDYVEKSWRLNYGHGKNGKIPYPSEGNFPVAFPAGGYLWDRAKEAGVSYRSYGEFVTDGKTKAKNLIGHFDAQFRGFDLKYSDLKRADRFIAELKRFETNGEMPRLQIVRLPNDHTHGSSRGFPTPTAYLAENDLALGRVVEAVSRSKFWPHTAIFVVEDDAQNGSDHVDAHRTVALVISPFTKRHFVDSTLYSTTSMLRTMELILGLQPMSQFDAAAMPMFNSFQRVPELRPFHALAASGNLAETNSAVAWGANLKMDFSKEDAADDLLLNEAVWRSVRGANQAMPAPVRAAFVRTRPAEDND